MKIFRCLALSALLAMDVSGATAQVKDGVLIRCGASAGHSFFFKDTAFDSSGIDWEEDGMTNGKIILVKLGDEWDIQFDDFFGSSGYRQDGAKVMMISNNTTLLTVGAFHTNYTDVYTFDFAYKVVAWSTNKIGPVPKVGAYLATCE